MTDDRPCPCCGSSPLTAQKVFLQNDERFTKVDPVEMKARSGFGAALLKTQTGGSSVGINSSSKPFSQRHIAVSTKLPMTLGIRPTLSQGTARVKHAGGKMVAKVK